jgi:hypothetical protein
MMKFTKLTRLFPFRAVALCCRGGLLQRPLQGEDDTSKGAGIPQSIKWTVHRVFCIGCFCFCHTRQCGYLYVIIYTKNSYMYLSQN